MSKDNWDSVKGFFRRKTQLVSEKYRDAPKTVDQAVDSSTLQVADYQKRIRLLGAHMGGLVNALAQTVSMMDAIKDDLNGLAVYEIEGLSDTGRSIELAVQTMRTNLEKVQTAFSHGAESRTQFDKDCERLHSMLDERKANLLEYDFFKNKLAGLRAKPPSDSARIPRNEMRLEEWSQKYEAANERVKQMSQQLIGQGSRLAVNTASTVTQGAGQFFDETGRTSRVVLLGQGMQQTAATAMAAAQASAASLAAQQAAVSPVKPNPTAAAQQAQQVAVEAQRHQQATKLPTQPSNDSFDSRANSTRSSLPAEARSSSRFTSGGDDPFKV